MANQWDDWMPTPCQNCGGIWDLNEMYPHPDRRFRYADSIPVVCPDCYRRLTSEETGDAE